MNSRCGLGAIVCIIRQVRREEGDEGMIGPEEEDVEEEEELYQEYEILLWDLWVSGCRKKEIPKKRRTSLELRTLRVP